MGLHALVVDDSTAMRAVVRKVLMLSGVGIDNCLEAADGREALEVLSRSWVDVILTDIHMPVMDGLEFLREVQRDDTLRRIPVVLITTESRKEILERALSMGARAHIRKPFQPETIKRVLEAVLGEEFARGEPTSAEGCDF